MSFAALRAAFRRHWPHYLAEAAGLAFFVTCAGLLTMLLEHPASPLAPWLPSAKLGRRVLMGLGMGLVITAIVYSPWGKRSGAHINPAVTLAFWQLGKLRTPDAVWYVLAQVLGASTAAFLLRLVFGDWYAHPAVKFTVTEPRPGPYGTLVAFVAEFGISFLLMLVLLLLLHSRKLKQYTGCILGALLALYIVFETPLSGMSLNPARSLGTALAAGRYHGLWLYWVAPPLAMWLATVLFRYFYHGEDLECAVLAGCGPSPASPHATGEEPPLYPTR
ncbi:aquaporin family protein [Hymenobacter sp. BT18]|uniref:MIP/aquaporin family protein n=1 Tax=Hymenobacter sp. BT18 TaxID=2835648 RepID=UPI00143ED630|nr:aquaporin [Hymenobacter sp. BT18]QIX61309.1 aquaporin family protein [Hymenobacter sp. BT18]